ncbi:MAG: hypothetical protein M3Z25_22145, partial [Actinomycetota bacterium]|nr:hypothetical protein [Actinomycetota bacterium]
MARIRCSLMVRRGNAVRRGEGVDLGCDAVRNVVGGNVVRDGVAGVGAVDWLNPAQYQDWLMSVDADNFTSGGRRHQFRVVVLGDQVLRVCEHVQADPDAPCNEAQGAVSTVLPA